MIETPRVKLRPQDASDADRFFPYVSDPALSQNLTWSAHTSIDETRDWLDDMIAISAGAGEDFVIERDGRAIGKAGFYRFPEIGFILRPDQWGQGLAREALAPLIERAFACHRLARIEADVDPRNLGSLKLLTRLGFRETGRKERTWFVGGRWCDSVYLELDAAGWSKHRA